jgi:hypothetical protein
MLAAECAWTVLNAEHTRLHELAARVEEARHAEAWRQGGPPAAALAELIGRLQAFDEATHRPKGVVLLGLLQGRSAEADDLLDRLEQRCRRRDELLSQARAMLTNASGAVTQGSADTIEALLQEHQHLMRAQLEEEDTLLHSHSAALLSREEWAAVLSSISDAVSTQKR